LNILNNTVSNNYGPGLWTDIQNINTLYEGNTCIDNLASGIFHEISYKATIRCNTLKGNANKHGAQIFISTSSDVQVYNNVVAISEAHPGDGIVVQQGNRTADESNGVIYRAKNNYVHHNDISYSSQAKLSGVRESYNPNNDFWATSNNAFNNNTYHVPAVSDPNTQKLWTWNNTSLNWSGMRAAGQEKQGVVNNSFPTTISLTANAGPDNTIALPVSNVTLTGSGSSTYEIASYLWTKVSGPTSGVMSGESTTTLSLTSLAAGTYVFRFTVATECNSSASDDVKVIVEPATSVLYRGINLNGPALPIDGENWEGSATATNFSFTGRPFANQTISLIPATTANKSSMIRSSYWRASGTDSVTVALDAVPVGTYEVFLYTWEDNTSTTFDIYLEGVKVIQDFSSGVAGTWKKHSLGQAVITDGNIKVKAKRGDVCISGIEVRKVIPYRAINLNGGALVVDGNNYEASSTAANFSFTGRSFANQTIALNPTTDASRASMIRSSFWRTSDSDSVTATLSAVSPGTYKVFLYTWEDNNSTTFDIYLEGVKKISAFASGTAGTWRKHDLGTAIVNDGNIKIKAQGGDACISGIEVWKVSTGATAREAYSSTREFEEESDSKINVYPVPFKNHITIELNENEVNAGAVQYAIVDVTGKTQRAENHALKEGQSLLEINNLEALHAGLYILRVRTDHTVRAVKIIKE
jgi:hypothetical protein